MSLLVKLYRQVRKDFTYVISFSRLNDMGNLLLLMFVWFEQFANNMSQLNLQLTLVVSQDKQMQKEIKMKYAQLAVSF